MTDNVKLKMTLPDIADIELLAIEGMNFMARHMDISDGKIGEARLLVAEAVINAFEHSGQKNPRVQVEFTMNQETLIIFVRDFGKGFNPADVEKPDITKKLGSVHKRGWGLKLMKSMSDDFRIESDEKGTKITITKKLQ